jgi:transcriptional regulator with XRE-family HTH domain
MTEADDRADDLDDTTAAEALADPTGLEKALGWTVARRVREGRNGLGLTVGQLAARSGLSKGMLSKIENAQASPSMATLARLSQALSMPVTAFFRGLDEEGDVLLVRAGEGLTIGHPGAQTGHHYQSLGVMRTPHDRLEPLLVTLRERAQVFPLYQHSGTELLHMLEGEMDYSYGGASYRLHAGDTLQFDGEVPHGPIELITLPIRFLAIKATTP